MSADYHVIVLGGRSPGAHGLGRILPIERVVGPADVASLRAMQITSNPALTGATHDVGGGQQLVVGRAAE